MHEQDINRDHSNSGEDSPEPMMSNGISTNSVSGSLSSQENRMPVEQIHMPNQQNNNSNNYHENQAQQQQNNNNNYQNPHDAHTRERLFDFIALLQSRRMDDQRASLAPVSSPDSQQQTTGPVLARTWTNN